MKTERDIDNDRFTGHVRPVVLLVLVALLAVSGDARAAPTVFPDGLTIHRPGVSEGYVLFRAPNRRVYLIDNLGTEVHTWRFPCGAGGALTPTADGGILARSCEGLVEVNWEGDVVWEFKEPEGVTFHHDWARLPGGNTLILARHIVNVPELSARDMRDDFLLEVTPSGDVVWEWHTADHFEQFGYSDERVAVVNERGGDWSHANTVAPIPEGMDHADPRFMAGNIVLSYRHTNSIVVVDRSTGDIVWVLTDESVGQHQAHMIPADRPGGGNILMFDNGWAAGWTLIPNQYRSRILEIDPDTKMTVFSYVDEDSGNARGTFFSFAIAGAERQPNGNTLIAEGRFGRIFEITPDKQIVWEYIVPIYNTANSNHIYRASRMPVEWAASRFSPDLVVTWAVPAGQTGGALYEATVRNDGAEPAVDAEVVLEAPAGAVFRELAEPTGWECAVPAVGTAGTIRCRAPSLGAGEGARFDFSVTFETCRAELRAIATASSVGDEANPADNSTSVETPRSVCNRSDGGVKAIR